MAEHHHHGGALDIDLHEGSLIGTIAGHISASGIEEAKTLLSSAMTELAGLINGAGGIIGHIKAMVSEEGRGYQISVTDEEAMVRSIPVSAYKADCAAIVFAVEERDLREFMERTVGKLIDPDEEHECEHHR